MKNQTSLPSLESKPSGFVSWQWGQIRSRVDDVRVIVNHAWRLVNGFTYYPKLVIISHVHMQHTHEHTHVHTHTGPMSCMNYDTCGPWRLFTVDPNDEEWDR